MVQIHKLLTRLFDVREGEFPRTLLMFSYLLSIIACYITTKSVRDSLFLKRIGPNELPYVYILIAIVVGFVASLYSKVIRRIPFPHLVRTTSLIAISNLFLFWCVLRYNWSWLFYVLYIWVSVFGVIAASQFWLLANYVFDPREAKRLFALIGAGGLLVGILGALFTPYVSIWFGTEALLLWCMGFMGISVFLLEKVTREVNFEAASPQADPGTEAASSETRRLLKIILNSRHLTMMTAILGITVIIESFIDYQLKLVSDQSFSSQDQLTSFFGRLFAYLGIFSLLFQVFVTSRIMKRFGVGISILFLPIGLFLGSLTLALWPSLLAAGFLKVSDGSFKHSIHRSGIELLYLPVPLSIKNHVKGFIDMFVDRLGRGAGGLLLLLFTSVLSLSITQLSLFVCGLIFVWIILSITVKKEYLNSFRLALEKKTIEPEMLRVRVSDSATLDALLNVLQSQDERQVLYAMQLLSDANSVSWLTQLQQLIQHPSPRVRAQALEYLASQKEWSVIEKVTQCLNDSDLQVRAEAIRYLCVAKDSDPFERIKQYLHHPNYTIVGAAVHCLAKYGGPAEGLIDQYLIEAALSEKGEQRDAARIAAACALGLISPSSPLQSYLAVLLQDPSPEVVRNAIHSAGHILSREALPLLIGMLGDRRFRNEAREALLQYGTRIVGTLSDYLNDPSESPAVRANIPKVLSLMGSQAAAGALVRSMNQANQFLGYRALKALNRMRVLNPGLSFNDPTIDSLIAEEL